MIIVMLVLLAATALAIFAVHATTFELRAAGHGREAMQSQFLAESGLVAALAMVDQNGPQSILYTMQRTREDSTLSMPTLMPYEPELAPGKEGYRLYLDDLATYGSFLPADPEGLYGPAAATDASKQIYQPTFMVDINDHYAYTGAIAGHRSDGYGRLQYLHATYTARGRMRLNPALGADPTDPDLLDSEGRAIHELASDARAHAVTGPFAR